MVLFVDLDEQQSDPHAEAGYTKPSLFRSSKDEKREDVEQDERENPNIGKFSEALACYPVVKSLASHLDLTTLSSLSESCRQFRANLLPYRSQLIKFSLRCSNESVSLGPRLADGLRESHKAWHSPARSRTGEIDFYLGRITSGKVGTCARDLVGDCRRCGRLVCRNCTIKPPLPRYLSDRHRRLCQTCQTAPVSKLIAPSAHSSSTRPTPLSDRPILLDLSTRHQTTLPYISQPRPPSAIKQDSGEPEPPDVSDAFTSSAFARRPCECDASPWLCRTCGVTLRTDDDSYRRGWAWRAQYSHLGSLATGAGDIQGVECGRGAACLAAKEVEREDDFDSNFVSELQDIARERRESGGEEENGRGIYGGDGVGGQEGFGGGDWTDVWREGLASGYRVVEVEGIGGVRKKVVRRMVRVGAPVRETIEEVRREEQVLAREKEGAVRSWCGWCDRLILRKGEEA